jgi:hypothetical protein
MEGKERKLNDVANGASWMAGFFSPRKKRGQMHCGSV